MLRFVLPVLLALGTSVSSARAECFVCDTIVEFDRVLARCFIDSFDHFIASIETNPEGFAEVDLGPCTGADKDTTTTETATAVASTDTATADANTDMAAADASTETATADAGVADVETTGVNSDVRIDIAGIQTMEPMPGEEYTPGPGLPLIYTLDVARARCLRDLLDPFPDFADPPVIAFDLVQACQP